jgi:bacterioferritin
MTGEFSSKDIPRSYAMNIQIEPVTKVSEKLKEMLNEAIAKEIQVSIQYLWQHVQLIGRKGNATGNQFRQLSIIEMKHAEKIVKRLRYLSGIPTTRPSPITIGESLKESLELDVTAEEETIQLYKKIIEQAQQEGDVTTGFLFKQILEDEEGHHALFTKRLEEVGRKER